jgi:hypothetical protein
VSVPEGAAHDSSPLTVPVPEGAAHDCNIPDALDEIVEQLKVSTTDPLPIAAGEWQGQEINNMVKNELTDTGRPRQNVGNYKQGPAKIRRLPIDGEQYDFSFSIFSDWEQPILVSANHSNVQANYHPQQQVNKSFIVECYLLQDPWFDDPKCLYHLYLNIIIDTWDTDEIYILEVTDPCILPA